MKDARALRFGLIGCGFLGGSVHLPNLCRGRGLQVTAVADPDADLRVRAARQAGDARNYASGKELLEGEELSAVVIASPPSTHAALAEQALSKGIWVYLEKPLALNEEDAGRVARLASAGDAHLMMGFNFRFSPVFSELRQKLRDGMAGEVLLARTVFTTTPREAGSSSGWYGQWEGDVLWELGSHHFDLIPYLFDSPIEAFSGVTVEPDPIDDVGRRPLKRAVLTLQLRSGLCVQSLLALDGCLENRVEVFGSNATLGADRFRSLQVEVSPAHRSIWDYHHAIPETAASIWQLPQWVRRLRATWGDPSYQRALEHFVESLHQGRQPSPNADDGLSCLRLVTQARARISKQ